MKTRAEDHGGGRREPYTPAGIQRLLCSRAGCGRRAFAQWSGCADGNLQRPLCPECDVDLNDLVMAWWGDPEAAAKMAHYRAEVEEAIGRPLDT